MALLLGLSMYGLQRLLVFAEFKQLEDQYARLNVDRVSNRFSVELARIDATVYDWSAWDDTYAFAENRNTAYVESNLYSENSGDEPRRGGPIGHGV
ncbi:CHASE4 domain-containing protein [Saccharospirillum impatiens]|uniref:CHASE4 domain-containing protein n=1 Tax=Saccharospirillum impatiens TaxID=169438 RepID=UPI00146DEBA1|nr:CHASE4 domain-containing protein [Saccharospirillum impatiens]